MKSESIIYKNIGLYRLAMNVLYAGKYSRRFDDVIKCIGESDKVILELCFGDLYVAEYCKKSGKTWKGIDMNQYFVTTAKSKGFDAECQDLVDVEKLPQADVCLIIGSYYHFKDRFDQILSLMLNSSRKVIISEPVKNLSSRGDIVGRFAKAVSNAGKGREDFRFTKNTFLDMLMLLKHQFDFEYKVIGDVQRDIIVEIELCKKLV